MMNNKFKRSVRSSSKKPGIAAGPGNENAVIENVSTSSSSVMENSMITSPPSRTLNQEKLVEESLPVAARVSESSSTMDSSSSNADDIESGTGDAGDWQQEAIRPSVDFVTDVDASRGPIVVGHIDDFVVNFDAKVPLEKLKNDLTPVIFRHRQIIRMSDPMYNVSVTWEMRVKKQKGWLGMHARVFDVQGLPPIKTMEAFCLFVMGEHWWCDRKHFDSMGTWVGEWQFMRAKGRKGRPGGVAPGVKEVPVHFSIFPLARYLPHQIMSKEEAWRMNKKEELRKNAEKKKNSEPFTRNRDGDARGPETWKPTSHVPADEYYEDKWDAQVDKNLGRGASARASGASAGGGGGGASNVSNNQNRLQTYNNNASSSSSSTTTKKELANRSGDRDTSEVGYVEYEHPITGVPMDDHHLGFRWVDAPLDAIVLRWQIRQWGSYLSWRPGNCVYFPVFAARKIPWAHWLLMVYPCGIRPSPPPENDSQTSCYLRLHYVEPGYRDRRIRVKIFVKVHECKRRKLIALQHTFRPGDSYGVADLTRADSHKDTKDSLLLVVGLHMMPLRLKGQKAKDQYYEDANIQETPQVPMDGSWQCDETNAGFDNLEKAEERRKNRRKMRKKKKKNKSSTTSTSYTSKSSITSKSSHSTSGVKLTRSERIARNDPKKVDSNSVSENVEVYSESGEAWEAEGDESSYSST